MKIKKIEKIEKPEFVYNLHIQNNHNYIANNIVVSNCHGSTAVSIQDISKKCVNSEYRLGFTGTLPENKSSKQTIIGHLGPVTFNVTAKELIDQNVLSKINIENVVIKYPKEYCVSMDYDTEMNFVTKYDKRKRILNMIVDKGTVGENTLILVNKIDHLKQTEEYLQSCYGLSHSVYVIYGDIKADVRESIRKKINSQGNVILIATYATASTGLNIPRLHNIVFYSSYKSKIKILQSIGRGLRKHESKESMILWDVVDDLRYQHGTKLVDNYIFKHFKARKTYYEEQGFKFTDSLFKLS